ncbi:hypothetical protein J1C56_07185 [Aminobacter anthyllidis]|uniref:Uncharacterized protein n=1 Tax=Aminobacter anthyllidis TaxID=1035067 RepID=A0A9X1D578_9HYPH|nr:hypothetical protein [Aminobacter anthyllidis]MBT1155373.1 hypothetical protein [Aminobacter anthyllidis]
MPVEHRKLHDDVERQQRLVVGDVLLRLRRHDEGHFQVGRLFQGGLLSLASRNDTALRKGVEKQLCLSTLRADRNHCLARSRHNYLSVDKFGARSRRLTAPWNCIPEDAERGQKLTVQTVHFGRGLLATQLICATLQPIGRFGTKTAAKERFPKAFQCLPD